MKLIGEEGDVGDFTRDSFTLQTKSRRCVLASYSVLWAFVFLVWLRFACFALLPSRFCWHVNIFIYLFFESLADVFVGIKRNVEKSEDWNKIRKLPRLFFTFVVVWFAWQERNDHLFLFSLFVFLKGFLGVRSSRETWENWILSLAPHLLLRLTARLWIMTFISRPETCFLHVCSSRAFQASKI